MAKEILFLETKNFPFPPALKGAFPELGGVKAIQLENLMSEFMVSGEAIHCMFASLADIANPEIESLFTNGASNSSCYFFAAPGDIQKTFAQAVFQASMNAGRSMGVKNFLAKNSTIYTESVFHAGGLGAKMDACFLYAKSKMGMAKAVNTWSALNALLYFALLELPLQGEAGTGERVDVQVGADERSFAVSICFDAKKTPPEKLLSHPLLSVPRQSADYFECRALKENSRFELILAFSLDPAQASQMQCISVCTKVALEKIDEGTEYYYKGFHALNAPQVDEKRVIKGFKKKFSEVVTTIPGGGAAPAPEEKTVVSGNDSLADQKGKYSNMGSEQKDALIAKLYKEIEEINDPLKRGVITNIKDGQLEGLKGNIKRLEDELVVKENRVKEVLAIADKAVQDKDESQKRSKEMETKLRQSQEAITSQKTQFEKQLEDAKKQNKELAIKMAKLTEEKPKAA